MDEPNARDVVQSLQRGLSVILAFSDHGPALTPGQLAAITGLSRPAVRRILITLGRLGYVRPRGSAFMLTPRVLRLGYAFLSSLGLDEVAQPHMEEFVAATSESCSLASLDDTEVVLVGRVPTRRVMSINLAVGSRLPAHATSMGHVLLASLPEEALEDYLARADLLPVTRHTITDSGALREELARVRVHGFSIVDQELEEGIRSVAAPVRDMDGRVSLAVASSVHAGRVSMRQVRDDYLPLILRTAHAISRDLGRADRDAAGNSARPV
jgi:IclR family transcriptional regulator, pca regulon regulatory protein